MHIAQLFKGVSEEARGTNTVQVFLQFGANQFISINSVCSATPNIS